jgi:tetratricopeptide (TPR) repeat protein
MSAVPTPAPTGPGPEAVLDRDQFDTLRVLGFLYLRLGLAPKAARLFQALSALDPQNLQTALSLAAATLDDGRPEEALALLERAPLANAAAWAPARLLKARALWRLGRHEETYKIMDQHLAAGDRA